MNYKEKLKNILAQFNELKSSVEKQLKQIRESDKYTSEYKNELIDEVKQKAKATQDKLYREAVEAITEAKNEVLKGKKSINKDQTFELKLSNALNILKTIGTDMTAEELKELIKPFIDDYYTMELLRKVFTKENIKGVNDILGINVIDHNVKTLDELQNYIAGLTGDIESINLMKVSIAMNYLE